MHLPGITRRAAEKIKGVMAHFASDLPTDEEYIAVVQWTTEDTSIRNFVPSLGLGAHPKADVEPKYIIAAYGIEIACWLPDEMIAKYRGSFIDFVDDRFMFIDATMKAIIHGDDG